MNSIAGIAEALPLATLLAPTFADARGSSSRDHGSGGATESLRQHGSKSGITATRLGSVVFGQHAANDVFVDLNAEGARNLLRDMHTAKAGVAPFDRNDCGDELC